MKIEHNRKLFYVIIFLVILLAVLILFIIKNKDSGTDNSKECSADSECIPNFCCHATGCVAKANTPLCEDVMCTAVCSGPLDCGEGHCSCIRGKCGIVKDK